MTDDPEYTYSSTIWDPSGVRVSVTTTVPSTLVGSIDQRLASDLAEVTQVGASLTANRVTESFKAHYERCPF